ncbi:hypothetical protein IKF03_03120 [Candidatus Saccharibacteria bacterium]|nr:hypothetical protein [Candidatus Saccharibacteria bacterium]
MSKRDQFVTAEALEAKETPVTTAAPEASKPTSKPKPLTSAELYARVEALAKEADRMKAERKAMLDEAQALFDEAQKLEASEKEAKKKAEAEAQARVRAAAKAEAEAKAKAKAYTGPVYIPGWSEDGFVKIGARFNGE